MQTPKSLHLSEIVEYGVNLLLKSGITNAKKEIQWLCEKKINNSQLLYSKQKKTLTVNEKNIIIEFINRRKTHEPFQYIIEEAPFYDKDFYVNRHVLIPRPETEIIIEALKDYTFKNAIDIGTGCGNLAVILSLHKIAENILAIDVSREALSVAEKNINKFNISNIDLKCINFLNSTINKKFDLIVSNPPYISNNDYKNLPISIKNYEPKIALTDCNNGYNFYNRLADNLNNLLEQKGIMLLEIGLENTKPFIDKIFISKGYKTSWYKDLNGNFRIIKVEK